jgi:hypothetical protein
MTQLGVGATHGLPHPPQLFGSLEVSTHAVGLITGHAVKPIVVQDPPQFVPSHVGEPPVGVGQAVHAVPHELVDVLLEQVPLQSWEPVGQAQAEVWQVFPPEHGAPQAPQLLLSVARLTHAVGLTVGQAVVPVMLQDPPQLVPSQVGVKLVGLGQAEHSVPQELVEVLLMHVPLQSCMPAGQTQLPAWQLLPPVHTVPQPPQLLLSLPEIFTHVVGLEVGHPMLPVGHTQALVLQLPPTRHALLHMPQLPGSFVKFTHLVPQRLGCAGSLVQAKPQLPALHVATPLEGGVHAVHIVPHELGEALLTHVPLQSCIPAGQAHVEL